MMTFEEKLKVLRIISALAEHKNCSMEEMLDELIAVIDRIWEKDDEYNQMTRALFFPNGKPTPAEFILYIAKYTEEDEKQQLEDLN